MRSRAGWLSVFLLVVAMPSRAYRMSAWVPSWDNKALTSMQLNAGKLDETNPEWYTVTADGGVAKLENSEGADWRAALGNTDVVPMIQNFVNGEHDAKLVENIIASPQLRDRHAESLTLLAVQNAYQGMDIDYESLNEASRANFTTFVELLAQKLHSVNKTLSVTVHAKSSDGDDWDGPAAQDWRGIGAAADTVKIMAYDEHYNGSTAGPITSIDYLDRVAAYAQSTIPAEKIVIGLPWYGYEWQGTRATDLTYTEAVALAQSVGAQITHDVNGEATFSYSDRVVYFQDASSYAKKTDAILQKHPKIAGFAHWRVGGEDPAIWTDVERLHKTSSTPVKGSFVITGAAAVVARAGQQSRFSYAITPIDGFDGIADVVIQQIDRFPGIVSVTQTARVGIPAVLTVMPDATATHASYRLVIRMTSGSLTAESAITVVIQEGGKRRIARH